MKTMRNILKGFSILIILITSTSCNERELFDTNFILPSITGLHSEISGSLSGKLTRQDSPYIVTDDLVIEIGDSLIIEPGVTLLFNERAKLIVKGFLKAEGIRNQRIYFTAYRSSWNGISFSSSNHNSLIKFCVIEKINPVEENGALSSCISFINSNCTLRNNYFRNSSNSNRSFFSLLNSYLTITNNIFMNKTFANNLINSDNANLRLINNVFFNNKSNNNQAVILINRSIYNEVQNNIFFRNSVSEEIQVIASEPQKILIDYNFFGSQSNDPYFWNFDNFRLYYLSPCIDAGNPARDFNDTDGSRNDQGAYGGPYGNW